MPPELCGKVGVERGGGGQNQGGGKWERCKGQRLLEFMGTGSEDHTCRNVAFYSLGSRRQGSHCFYNCPLSGATELLTASACLG